MGSHVLIVAICREGLRAEATIHSFEDCEAFEVERVNFAWSGNEWTVGYPHNYKGRLTITIDPALLMPAERLPVRVGTRVQVLYPAADSDPASRDQVSETVLTVTEAR